MTVIGICITKRYRHFSFPGPPKFNQIGTFGQKIYHLATLISFSTLLPTFKKKEFIHEIHGKNRLHLILFENIFEPMPFLILFNTLTNHMKLICYTQQHCYVFPKILYVVPWRDSNPDLLSLKRMRCPLRHAASASFFHVQTTWDSNPRASLPAAGAGANQQVTYKVSWKRLNGSILSCAQWSSHLPMNQRTRVRQHSNTAMQSLVGRIMNLNYYYIIII
jgi:hypothetical protein